MKRIALALGLGAAFAAAVTASAVASVESAKSAPAKQTTAARTNPTQAGTKGIAKVTKSDAEWRRTLTAEQYRVLREKGTERAFTGALWNQKSAGVYRCAGCGLELFRSNEKFDSGTGWPSFWAPVVKAHVAEERDVTLGMVRVEAVCARCGGHLGHVFDDGPRPTGLRYCINSAALTFETKAAK